MAEEIKKVEEKNVVMTSDQYNSLMARVEATEKAVKGGVQKPKRINERTATLRELDGYLVIGNKGTYEKINERTMKEECHIVLLVKNDKEVVEKDMLLLDYLNNTPKIPVKIVSQVATERESITGSVMSSPTDQEAARKKGIPFSSQEVDMIVTTIDYVSKIEVTDGKHSGETLEINNTFLND